MNQKVTPPVGNQLSCENWQIEAAYRMIQHNLDQNVAENPDELIVYGGKGKAARNWESYGAILETLKRIDHDESLLVPHSVDWREKNAECLLEDFKGELEGVVE